MLMYLPLLLFVKAVFCSTPSIIIIGAGPAGIAAATRLIENNLTNIKILEAENRIGGRIYSVKFGDAFVDFGAEFCHGEEGNIVYNLVKDLDVLVREFNTSKFNFYYSDGSKISSALVSDWVDLIANKNFEYLAKKYKAELPSDTKTSLGDYILNVYNNTILKHYFNDPKHYQILKDAIPYFEKEVLANEAASSWFDVSFKSNSELCQGDQGLTWNGYGFKIILDVLMKSFPDPSKKLSIEDKIFLNEKVTRIYWNESRILLETKKSNCYLADHVIFTPSVGVLKAEHKKLFDPKLPLSKQRAIEDIGFGCVFKIIMHFSTKWWNDDYLFSGFVWNEKDLKETARDLPKSLIKNEASWVTQILSVVKSANNSNVLIAWVSGSWVPEIEKLSTETLKEGVVYVLRKFLGGTYNIVEPDKIIHSSWCSNPNFRGTWSYETVESHEKDPSNQNELSQPLTNNKGVPILLFAGEATNHVHYSTVHGAIETGYREADRIIHLFKKDAKHLLH